MNVTQTQICRWTARILGLMATGLLLLFAIGEGFDFQALTPVTAAMSVALLVSLSGMLAIWRWELAGGVMVVIGMTAFYLTDFVSSGSFPGGWVFPLFFVPGILAIACSRHSDNQPSIDQTTPQKMSGT